MADDDRIDALDVVVLVIIGIALYAWFRAAGKIAEVAAPALYRFARPTVRSVIERAEVITREAAEGGS